MGAGAFDLLKAVSSTVETGKQAEIRLAGVTKILSNSS